MSKLFVCKLTKHIKHLRALNSFNKFKLLVPRQCSENPLLIYESWCGFEIDHCVIVKILFSIKNIISIFQVQVILVQRSPNFAALSR